MARRCPDGINKFSTRVSGDNSVKSGGADDEELEANARAIAALPELLAALEEVQSMSQNIADAFLLAGFHPDNTNRVLDLVQAALTQAGYTFD